jgi:ribosomal protein S18 acetylase RimI-like enzyme
MSYEIGPLRGVDFDEWSALTASTADADGHLAVVPPDELAHYVESIDLDRDGWQVTDGARLVGVATVEIRAGLLDGRVIAQLDAWVHPDFRGRGVGRRLLDLQERRAVELAAERRPDSAVRLRTWASETALAARRLLTRRGYRAARSYAELSLALTDWRAPEAAPIRAEPFHLEFGEEVRQAHLAAFADHWGSTPPSREEWERRFTGSPTFRPDVSRIVVEQTDAGHQLVIAYALLYQFLPGEAYVGAIGVRPERQRRGLGRATLVAALQAARDAGYPRSGLGVDGENVHNAARLYESLGYTVEFRSSAFVRDVANAAKLAVSAGRAAGLEPHPVG